MRHWIRSFEFGAKSFNGLFFILGIPTVELLIGKQTKNFKLLPLNFFFKWGKPFRILAPKWKVSWLISRQQMKKTRWANTQGPILTVRRMSSRLTDAVRELFKNPQQFVFIFYTQVTIREIGRQTVCVCGYLVIIIRFFHGQTAWRYWRATNEKS